MSDWSDEEHERLIEDRKAAITQVLRKVFADDDTKDFEVVALPLSAFCGRLILSLSALLGDREGIVVMSEATDQHVEDAADCLMSLWLSIVQIAGLADKE